MWICGRRIDGPRSSRVRMSSFSPDRLVGPFLSLAFYYTRRAERRTPRTHRFSSISFTRPVGPSTGFRSSCLTKHTIRPRTILTIVQVPLWRSVSLVPPPQMLMGIAVASVYAGSLPSVSCSPSRSVGSAASHPRLDCFTDIQAKGKYLCCRRLSNRAWGYAATDSLEFYRTPKRQSETSKRTSTRSL
jgi:hypothetical protein